MDYNRQKVIVLNDIFAVLKRISKLKKENAITEKQFVLLKDSVFKK